MTERFLHYSEAPLTERHHASQRDPENRRPFKPSGLWISVEGPHDWRQWCESEGFNPDRYRYQTVIELTGRGRRPVLTVRPDGLMRFTMGNRNHNSPLNNIGLPPSQGGVPAVSDIYAIDWQIVARRYSGIIIAPYSFEHRWTLMWYYTWDCASGCLWDADAWRIASPSEPVRFRQPEAEPPGGDGPDPDPELEHKLISEYQNMMRHEP